MAQSYTVRPNDTLSAIAARYGVSYQEIAKANNIADPNRIYPGQTFNIPDKPGSVPAPTPQPTQTPQATPSPSPSSGVPPVDMSKYAGWNDQAAIQADWALHWREKSGGGGTSAPGSPSVSLPARPPAPDLSGLYTRAIEESTKAIQPEITAAQGKLTEVQSRIEQKRRSLAEAEANINDNPYYSEATRVGRIAKLREKAQQDIAIDETEAGIAQSGIALAENKLSTAKADAQVKLNIAAQEYNIKSSEYQQNLQLFSTLLTSGALETASGADISQITTATGMSSSMVQSIIDFQKKKNAPKPEIKTADDGTNQYVVAIDPLTAKVINKEIIAKSKPEKATVGGTKDFKYQTAKAEMITELQSRAGDDKKVSPQAWLEAMQGWLSENPGETVEEFVRAFSRFVDTRHSQDYYGYDKVFKKGEKSDKDIF